MKYIFLFVFFICAISYSQPLSPRIANYNIDVRLDEPNKMLFGKEVLAWHNKSLDVISELQFHLYMNGFRNSKSTFMKESGGRLRGIKMDKDGWGYIDVKKMTLQSGEDVTSALQFIQPDDGNTEDKTVVRLPLTTPLKPGDSISLSIDFEVKLPQPPFARTGVKEEYFFVGQWFPKFGVYIDGKWNCHQFHANSEFFADYGVYDVRINVPEKNIVGATGLEREVKSNGDGTATHYFHAEDVHDFAWTTSPEFIEVKGKEQDVDIRVLMQPDHIGQGERHLEAAKLAVRYHQNWYGDYPFPNLTVVDPRRGGGGSGGMEYPTLITAGTAYGVPDGIRIVELVIIHEFGHNYWYHLLASNEFEESWLDEGINTYTEIQIMNDAYGSGSAINWLGLKMNDIDLHRGQYISLHSTDPTVKNAWEYASGGSYGVNSYSKPGLILKTFQNYIGKEKMQEIMRAYFERWKFKHPKSQDFVNVVNDVTGTDFNWFFNQALYTAKMIDYSIEKISSNEVKAAEGYDYTFSDDKSEKKDDETKEYETEIVVRRIGDFTFPVEVEIVFENGEKVRDKWDGNDLWKKFKYTKASRLKYATVDPERKVVLDINYTNNSRTLEPQSAGVNKTALKFMFYLQMLFDQPDLMNILTFFTGNF